MTELHVVAADPRSTEIAARYGWHRVAEEPPVEGTYLIALRATHTRAPRIDIAHWDRKFGWTSKFTTHWQELPKNPNQID